MTIPQRGLLWIVCLILGAAYFFGIQSTPLRDYRETTYAEIGREMLESGDCLVPHLNYTPHLDKPPMVPWLVTLSFKSFGTGQWQARVPSVLSILWTALVVGWITRRVFGTNKGILGALLFLSAPGMQHFGRMLMTDTTFMALTTTAMAAFLEGYLRDQRIWYRLGFVACGLAVLSRGPIGAVYPLGALILFFILADRKAWKSVPWATGFLLFLVIAVPWYALIEIKHPGFLDLFIVKHHFNRLLPVGSHSFVAEPRWQILLGFLGFLGPMVLLLPWAITQVRGERSANHMLWLLPLLVIASVMISTGRNHPYTFPAVPPLAAIVAGWLGARADGPLPFSSRFPAVLVGLLGIAVLGAIPWLDVILGKISPLLEDSATRTTVKISLALVAASIFVGSLLLWRGKGVETCVALALVMLPGAYMLIHAQKQVAPVKSRASLASIVAQEIPPTWPVVIANPRDRLFEGVGGWGFYARRQVRMVAFEPPVGPFQGVSRPEWIIDMKDLVNMWKSDASIVLAATSEAVAKLPFRMDFPPRARDEAFGLWMMPQRHSRGIPLDSR